MTIHIGAKKEDIAEIVIMPGDPLRAKFIAEKYLENARLVSNVRLILAYTGYYHGTLVTVMASGMGMPSMAIYAFELYQEYDVKKIIRIGSCGSYHEAIHLKDIILVEKAYTLSNFAMQYNKKDIHMISSSTLLNQKIMEVATKSNIELKIGNINTSDIFYEIYKDESIKENYCLGVEMESFALLYVANELEKEATAILTVSDNLVTNEKLDSLSRERSFEQAILLGLNALI